MYAPKKRAEPTTSYRYLSTSSGCRNAEQDLRALLARFKTVGVHFQISASEDSQRVVAVTVAWSASTETEPAWVLPLGHMDPTLACTLLTTLLVGHDAPLVISHDITSAAYLLSRDGFLHSTPRKLVDLQLAFEEFVDARVRQADIWRVAQRLAVQTMGAFYQDAVCQPTLAWDLPRIPENLVASTITRATLALRCLERLQQAPYQLSTPDALQSIMFMTTRRWELSLQHSGRRMMWFDDADSVVPRSLESFSDDDVAQIPMLQLECEVESLLELLPSRFRDAVRRIDRLFGNSTDDVSSDVAVVTSDELVEILTQLGGEAKIGDDNRAGIDRQLHRISVMRNKTQQVYGLTLRVGRTLRYASNMLLDLLLSPLHRDKSVLLLGRPGSGKTTLIRDIARCISETGENVCIIDTSNEIGGDGVVPHGCIGWARRMMVRSLDEQASVMIECVQNHTVETLIVDEIGRKAEVNSAGTVRQRGPRLIASAHGDLSSLIKNADLKGLIGGVQSVTVGDAEAKKSVGQSKVQAKRSGNPIFEVIVELDEVVRGRCRIIWDVASAVDLHLSGKPSEIHAEERFQSMEWRGVQCG
ncbi:hypothetical protein PINS_up010244 [Pythium insidiosum]|nr:hypothetical protein PINS_up010244 [Pythium insidiosum]